MGGCPPLHHWQCCRSRVLLLCVVALQGVLWQTGAAAPLCGDTCAVDVRPVCGDDGRSYSNGCVASCAGVAVASQGYCKGDRVRFKQTASSSSSFLGSIPWRLAKESGHVITADVLNKFAAEGFVYRGRVDLASLNQRTGYKAGTAHRHSPKEHSSMFQQDASTTASQQAAARPTSVRPSSSAAADSATTPVVAAEGRVTEANPRAPAKAPAAVAARPAQSATVLDVAVVRVDNAGNLYTKTYTYDSSRFSQMAYPPFNPAGAALVESKVATGTKAAASTPAAQQQQQQAAKAATTPPAAGAAAPSPAAKAAPAPAASGSRQPGRASGRAAAGSTGAVVRSPVGAERKASSSLPLSSAPATAAAGRQPLPEGAARLDLQQGDVQGSRAREQMQEQGLQGNVTSSSANATAAANSTQAAAAPDITPAAAEQLLQQQRAAAADLATPQQPLRQKLAAPAPLQLEKEALSRSQQQQLPLSGAAQAKRPDYMTSPVRQGMSELAKDVVRQTISSGGSSPGSSSGGGKVADAVKKEQLIPELAAVDPKGFEETAPILPKGAPSSSSSSSSSASKTAPPAAAVAAPVQGNGLKQEGAQQQQQQQQQPPPKGPQQMSAPTIVAEEAEPAAAAAPAAAGSKADPAKPDAASPAAAATKPVAAATKPEAAAVAAPEAAPAAPTTKPATPPAAAGAAAPTKAETGAAAAADPSAAAPGASSSSDTARSTPPPAATPALPDSSSSSSKDGKVLPGAASPQPAKALPPCNAEGLYCRDKILATSPMFGRQPPAGKFMDQAWLAGKARISGVKMFYNTTSGCLRGLQLTYKPNAAAAAAAGSNGGGSSGSSGSSGSGLGSGPVVKLLGSGYLHADIAVQELRLREGEIIGKAEVWDPKCIKYLRLFTSKGQKVSVGRIDPGAEGQARNVTKNRDNGLLLAVKGWQDPPKKHGATAKKPAGSSPGVLKQLQFVWGAPWCDQKCTPVHPGAAGPAAGGTEEPATLIAESGSLASAGHQRALLQQQQEQQLSDSIEQRLDAQVQSEQAAQQQHLHVAAAATAAEAQLPPLLVQDAEEAGEQPPHHQQLWRLAATAVEGDPWATAELELTAAMQQGALWATPTPSSSSGSSSGSSNGSVVVPASVHRMLSVIKPDNRLPCPTRTFPFYAMGQIKAKASDGGFVCSGGLIGSNRVLTAGHCVWDDRNAQGPFRDLRFAPGQWKAGAKVESPFGFVDWDYVTLFDTYINDPDGEGLPFDVAVITLNKPVGTELGWLGVRADAPPCRATPLTLNLAGYPGEDPENPRVGGWAGGCFYDKCDVSYSCSVSITNHTCDSYVGQSGAPMFDDEHYVRAVHTLGVLPGFSNTNGAITIQKFMLDNVMGYWRDTAGYSVSRTGAQARGAESGSKRGKRRRRH